MRKVLLEHVATDAADCCVTYIKRSATQLARARDRCLVPLLVSPLLPAPFLISHCYSCVGFCLCVQRNSYSTLRMKIHRSLLQRQDAR